MVARKTGISTRERIVTTARRLFAASGYEGTSTETVLQESGVSRGALYHHFATKEALFAAVLETVEVDVMLAAGRASANAEDPVAAICSAFAAFLNLACEQEVRQIVLIDASSVLGWQKLREIEERYGLGHLKEGLRVLARMGRIREDMVDVTAHMLLAALIEVAFLVARAPVPGIAAESGRNAMNEMLERLLGS